MYTSKDSNILQQLNRIQSNNSNKHLVTSCHQKYMIFDDSGDKSKDDLRGNRWIVEITISTEQTGRTTTDSIA
jgi:hypothetical protein